MRTTKLALFLGLIAVGCGSPEVRFGPALSSGDLFGVVLVTATVSGGEPDEIAFYLDTLADDQLLGRAMRDANGAYAQRWFTTSAGDGPHTLIAVADIDGERVEAELSVSVRRPTRGGAIPASAVKMTPASDPHPPILEPAFAAVFAPCAPLGGPVNTAGAEDSPFITADGQDLYTFFTPDASVPANLQLGDRVTGIYHSRRAGTVWTEPERVWLSYHDAPALDGCETVFGDQLWFCTARAGVEREIDVYVARREDDHWIDWTSAGGRLNLELDLGELHVADGGTSIYYHSSRAGGHGGADIWVTRLEGGTWTDAVNLDVVNSAVTDGWPWVSADGQELWFTRGPAAPEIWRALKVGGAWQPPVKVVGPFAGEPAFDAAGNLYFTHHFWDDRRSAIIEADIYVCARK